MLHGGAVSVLIVFNVTYEIPAEKSHVFPAVIYELFGLGIHISYFIHPVCPEAQVYLKRVLTFKKLLSLFLVRKTKISCLS